MSKQASKPRSRSSAPTSGEQAGAGDSLPATGAGVAQVLPVFVPIAGKSAASENDSTVPDPTKVRPGLVGWTRVDGDNVLRGWVTDRLERSERFEVDILINGEPVASLMADLLDPKLVDLGEGDGRYAFALVIPTKYRNGQAHRFEVLLRSSGFILKSKQAHFNIPADQTTPSINLTTVDLAGVAGVLSGGQYGKSAELHLWRAGQRLDFQLDPIWTGGREDRKFLVPFTPQILATLAESDLMVAASGMVEADLSGAVIARAQFTLAAQCYDDGRLVVGLKSPFNSEIHELRVDVGTTSGGEPLKSCTVPFLQDTATIDLPADLLPESLMVSVTTPGKPLPPMTTMVKATSRLVVNGSFQSWSKAGPVGWEVAMDERSHRGFYAFPERIASERGVSGDCVHFQGGFASETVLLRQKLKHSPAPGAPITAALLFRASDAARVRLRIVDSTAEELAVIEIEALRAWTWVFVERPITLEPTKIGDLYIEVVAAAGDVTIEVAGARVGGAVFTDPIVINEAGGGSDNLVENASLAAWPHGVAVDLVGRVEITPGWFGLNHRSAAAVRARAIFADDDLDETGLALASDDVREYCRLEVRLDPHSMARLESGVVKFEVGAPQTARRLLSASSVAMPEFQLVDRILLLRRSKESTEAGFNLVDETLCTVGRKLVVGRQYRQFELAFRSAQNAQISEFAWEEPEQGAEEPEYFLVFEFRRPFAVAFRRLSLQRHQGNTLEPTPRFLALEDRNIAAQAEHVRGLGTWIGDQVIQPNGEPDPDCADEGHFHRWRWSMAIGSAEVVVCVHNAIEETLACLGSLIGTTSIPHTVRIIDDGSSLTVHHRLKGFIRDKPWMTLNTNAENRGYTYSADRGIRESEADWVVLLNSDTVVTPGWLEGLMECALSNPSTGIVGPLSNAATFQSIPDLHDSKNQWKANALPDGWTPARMSALVQELSVKAFPEVPLLNGFCMLMRRAVFLEVGGFNHKAFPTGYGEENDLCLRVRKAGYRLALADQVYVYHSKSASFGGRRRTELAKAGGKALKELHPDVNLGALTVDFREIPALVNMRAAIRSACEASFDQNGNL